MEVGLEFGAEITVSLGEQSYTGIILTAAASAGLFIPLPSFMMQITNTTVRR